jgi:hypothetical protein
MPTRFVWLLLVSESAANAHDLTVRALFVIFFSVDAHSHVSPKDLCEGIAFMMQEEDFHCEALECPSRVDFFYAVDAFLVRMRAVEDVEGIRHLGDQIMPGDSKAVKRYGTFGKGKRLCNSFSLGGSGRVFVCFLSRQGLTPRLQECWSTLSTAQNSTSLTSWMDST